MSNHLSWKIPTQSKSNVLWNPLRIPWNLKCPLKPICPFSISPFSISLFSISLFSISPFSSPEPVIVSPKTLGPFLYISVPSHPLKPVVSPEILGTFPKDFPQVATSQGYFTKSQLPKCAISQVATSQVCPSRSARLQLQPAAPQRA